MKILALEFSSEQRGVAVVSTDATTASVLAVAGETGAQSVQATQLIERALAEAGLARGDIEGLAVGLGPGSYMGIRIAIALAQGWQLAREVKLLGVSSVAALAAAAWEEGLRGRVQVAIDAQRAEVYLAGYELTDVGAQERSPLRLAPMAEARTLGEAGETVIGPEVNRWFEGGKVRFPQARQLGLLAARREDFVAGETLEPIYLRAVSFVKAPPTREV